MYANLSGSRIHCRRSHRGLLAVAAVAGLTLASCSGGGMSGDGTTVAGSRWSDPETWGGQVPANGAVVMIPAGRTIVLDTQTAALDELHVQGTLQADPETDVAITANSIMVMQ